MATAHREYVLEVFSDQHFVRDIVKGMLAHCLFERPRSEHLSASHRTKANSSHLDRRPSHHIFPQILSLNPTVSIPTFFFSTVQQFPRSRISANPASHHTRTSRGDCSDRNPYSSASQPVDFTIVDKPRCRRWRVEGRDCHTAVRSQEEKDGNNRGLVGPLWRRASDRGRDMLGRMGRSSRGC